MDQATVSGIGRTVERVHATAGEFGFVGLWPENVPIVEAFMVSATQWRIVARPALTERGGFVFLGLDYAGARAGIEAAGITITPALWDGVRIMEAEAIKALNGING